MSVTLNAGGLPVNVALVLQDIGAVHLAVLLMVIGDDTAKPGVLKIGVWDGAVKGGVGGAFTVVAAVELWAMPGIVGGIGDLAVKALVGSGGMRSGSGRF